MSNIFLKDTELKAFKFTRKTDSVITLLNGPYLYLKVKNTANVDLTLRSISEKIKKRLNTTPDVLYPGWKVTSVLTTRDSNKYKPDTESQIRLRLKIQPDAEQDGSLQAPPWCDKTANHAFIDTKRDSIVLEILKVLYENKKSFSVSWLETFIDDGNGNKKPMV